MNIIVDPAKEKSHALVNGHIVCNKKLTEDCGLGFIVHPPMFAKHVICKKCRKILKLKNRPSLKKQIFKVVI